MFGLVYGAKRHFQQYFSYIVAVSFIGGGNRSTRGKPPTCCKNWDKSDFSSFVPNKHQLYILRHCIHIVFILHKNHINP
jgi:hypothetical protein